MDCSFGAIQNPSKRKGLFNKGSLNREALWHIRMLSVSVLRLRGGYFEVFTLQLPLFLAKLRPHGCTAEKKHFTLLQPPPQAQVQPKAIFLENIFFYQQRDP